MSLLSGKQSAELNRAVLQYLRAIGATEAASSLAAHLGQPADEAEDRYDGLLEKKWTSVVRLQRKIMDLEARVASSSARIAPSPASSASPLPRTVLAHSLHHRAPVTALALHPALPIVLSASEDAVAKLWNYEDQRIEAQLKGHTKSVDDVAWAAIDNTWHAVTCSADLSIKIWSEVGSEWRCSRTLQGHDHSVSSLAFLPNSLPPLIVSASRDKTLRVWDITSGYSLKTLSGHADWVRCVRASPDGKLCVSGSSDHVVRVWDPHAGSCKAELRGHDHVVECVAFVPSHFFKHIEALAGITIDNKDDPCQFVISGSRDRTIRLWEIATQRCLYTFNGHDNWVRALSFPSVSTSHHFLSASDDKSIKCWDMKTGRCSRTLADAHSHFVTALECVSEQQGLVCVSGGVDMEVKMWQDS